MDPKTFRRSSFLILFFSLLFCKCAVGAGPAEIWVTNPWLTMVARFIGGAQVNVRPLVVWNDSGITEKTRKEPPGGTLVIAVDNEEIIRFLGKAGLERPKTFRLFEKGVPGGNRDENFLDPAALPFIALRVLEILSASEPSNYTYYQRRLAEFQARLDSTVIVGRNMIGSKSILDLSWKYGRWLQASAGKVVRPPDAVKDGWASGKGIEVLETALEEALRQKWLIVTDPWTPEFIRERVGKMPGFMELSRPGIDQDMILFLYDVYLQIWDYSREFS